REYCGKAAFSCCFGACFDGLSVFAARLTQVHVHINQAWQQYLPGTINSVVELLVCASTNANCRNLTVFNHYIDWVTFAIRAHISEQCCSGRGGSFPAGLWIISHRLFSY